MNSRYLSVAGNGDKEEVSLTRITGKEATLFEILEEEALTGILPRQVPWRLEVSTRVCIHLEIPLHLLVIVIQVVLMETQDEAQRFVLHVPSKKRSRKM
jgi:hypothetical protein